MDYPPTQHILTERPWLFWFMGVIFGGIGLWLLPFTPQPTSKIVAAIFLGVGLLLGVVLAATTHVSLDRNRRVLVLDYRYLYRRSRKEIPLDELASIEVERSYSNDSGSTYRIIFVKHSGEVIPLHSYYSSGYLGKQKTADKIRQAVGMTSLSQQLGEWGRLASRAAQAATAPESTGVTNQITWSIETKYYGAVPITRWHSQDFSVPGDFILLVQKIPSLKVSGGLMKAVSSLLLRQLVSMYGFSTADLPGLAAAKVVEQIDPRLEPYFTVFSNAPERLMRLLHPWVIAPLVAWAEKYPLDQIASPEEPTGQLAMLASPSGVYLAIFQASSPEIVDELTATGAEVVRSLQSVAPSSR